MRSASKAWAPSRSFSASANGSAPASTAPASGAGRGSDPPGQAKAATRRDRPKPWRTAGSPRQRYTGATTRRRPKHWPAGANRGWCYVLNWNHGISLTICKHNTPKNCASFTSRFSLIAPDKIPFENSLRGFAYFLRTSPIAGKLLSPQVFGEVRPLRRKIFLYFLYFFQKSTPQVGTY